MPSRSVLQATLTADCDTSCGLYLLNIRFLNVSLSYNVPTLPTGGIEYRKSKDTHKESALTLYPSAIRTRTIASRIFVTTSFAALLLLLAPARLAAQEHNHDAAPANAPSGNGSPVSAASIKDARRPSSEVSRANRGRFRIRAARVDKGPRLDGSLDDDVWQLATTVDGFVQQEPQIGEPATERTEVRVLYDEKHIYIGVYAFDSDPSGIIATEMHRDSDRILEEDNFQVIFDTFNDYRSGYMFVTSPLGAKLEQQIFEEGQSGGRGSNSNINKNWDGVWDVATRRTAEGWVAEIEIPSTTMRFRKNAEQEWGINFERNIRRKNEQVFWAPIPKAYSLTRVSLAGTLEGIHDLDQGMDLRIKPFVSTGYRFRQFRNTSTLHKMLNDQGLDVKYGLTSGLNLDVTVNTDFAQAEVDEQQINLTRFALVFPEKRDFFLENAGLFNVGMSSGEESADLFFSRRIGLSDTGQPIPIIAGTRLTGKVGRNSVALMDIQTDREFGLPGANFFVSRYSRDILARSRVGALFINKEASDHSHTNRTMALDTNLALTRSLTINSFVAKTSTPGISSGDMAYFARIGFRSQAWDNYIHFMDLQNNFNPEVGFIPRTGIRTGKVKFGPTPRPGKFNIRLMEPMLVVTYTMNQQNELVSRRVHHMVAFHFNDGTYLNFILNRDLERLDKPFEIRRGLFIPTGTYRFHSFTMQAKTNPAKRFYAYADYVPQTFYGGDRTDYKVGTGVRATRQFSTEIEYRRNDVDLPWGEFEANLGIARVDYAISPKMTLRSLIQYNSSTHETSTSVRFNWIYRPGSDIYLVYNDLRGAMTANMPRERQLVLKWNYLLTK